MLTFVFHFFSIILSYQDIRKRHISLVPFLIVIVSGLLLGLPARDNYIFECALFLIIIYAATRFFKKQLIANADILYALCCFLFVPIFPYFICIGIVSILYKKITANNNHPFIFILYLSMLILTLLSPYVKLN
ncbi:MAG: hypothetical protein NEHIOOID_00051 [Holosporales bacterium]